jgi:two-component system, cell cycle sensor histidine kinase and response regulator CckA
MLGYTRAEMLRLHSMDLMSVADVSELPAHFEELRAGKTVLVERPVRRKDGTFIVGDVSAKMLEDGRLHASIRDVTERKRLENELRDAQQLEAVGRLAAGVAEDFDGLLERIRAHADTLAGGANGDAAVRTEAEEIRRATDWGSTLTRQLLAVGRRQQLNPTVVDLNALLEERRQTLRSMLGEGIELELEAGSELDRVRADAGQLEQVIFDLVLSARDAMPHGGTLSVTTANVEFDRRDEAVHGTGGRHVMLAIADTGDRDAHSAGPRMFEPYAGDEPGERRGLGLAAVYGIVHQSGGSIGVESEPGRGTTVRVYLPSAQVAEPSL